MIPPDSRYEKYVISNKQLRVRLDRSQANPNFVYAWLSSPLMVRYLENMNNGGAVPLLNLGIVRKVPVPLPPIETQNKIADILSAYDGLIENNRRRIALLEEAARLLYREWFVHFHFPGYEHVKVIDELPEGWVRRTLVELAEIVMGQSPKSQFYNDTGEGLPFHQGVTDYGFRFVSHRIYSTAVTKIAQAGDILVSVRAPVGRINITRTGLFSIAHNALANAFLHAQAGWVEVRLDFQADGTRLSVSDDGVGLPEDYAERGRGFSGMEKEAERMGGRLIVETGGPEGGTTIACVVPHESGSRGD